MACEELRHRVVACDVEDDGVTADLLGVDIVRLAGSDPDVGQRGLNEELPIRGKMTGGVLEAADLVVGVEQVEDGVEDQVHQPVAPAGGGAAHIAERGRDLLAAGFGAEPFAHMRRPPNAVHADAGRGEADRELQCRASLGARRKKRHGGRLVAARIGIIARSSFFLHVQDQLDLGKAGLKARVRGPQLVLVVTRELVFVP